MDAASSGVRPSSSSTGSSAQPSGTHTTYFTLQSGSSRLGPRARDIEAVSRRRPGRGPARPRRRRRAPRSAPAGRAGRPGGRAAAGRMPVACSTASGNLAGWAVARADHRAARSAARSGRRRARPRCAGRRGTPVASCTSRMTVERLVVVERGGVEAVGRGAPRPTRGPGSGSSSSAGARAVAAEQLEQQPLVVRRHLDVHAGLSVGTTGSAIERAVVDPAGEDVVAVGADHELVDRQRPSARRSSRRRCCRSCRSARRTTQRPSRRDRR